MLPLILGLGGAAVGAFRGHKQAERQQDIEDQSRKQYAAQVRNSPWTGRTSFDSIKYASGTPTEALLGGAMQGGMSGAAFGQGLGGMGGEAAKPTLTSDVSSETMGEQMPSQDPFSAWPGMQQRRGVPVKSYV